MEPNTLLLVEDEFLILEIMESELLRLDSKLSLPTPGRRRLRSSISNRVRAVITDIKLGAGADGWQVSRRARELVPEMPVLYLTPATAHRSGPQGRSGEHPDCQAVCLSPSRHGARGAFERSRPRHATNGRRLKRPQSLLEQCSRFCRYHGTRFLVWRVGAAIPGPAPGATPCPTKDPGSVIRPNGTKLVATY
jgi:hypothetical protein